MSLVADNIDLRLGRQHVLDGVTLSLAPRQVIAVLGPNGAGKSSLLRVMSGEWLAGQGHAHLDGRPLAQWPARELATRLAVLPQHSTLDFAFTAAEVVMLGRIPHASGRARDRDIVHAALARVDAAHFATRLYTELSGGERQRVHLARVLAQAWPEPAAATHYLLLDEPTAAFDLAHQQMMVTLMRELADDGAGVMVVLHDLNLAARVADSMVLLKHGRLAASGAPAAVMDADTIREVFAVDAAIGAHPQSGTPLAIL